MSGNSKTDQDALFSGFHFPVGVAVNFNTLETDQTYKEIITSQFNSITAENIFKACCLWPEKNFFDWTNANRLAGYCEFHNKRLHGHTLIWHEALPGWMLNETENIFDTYISKVVSYFKNNVCGWDVVNEAFDEHGNLKETFWKKLKGTDYIEQAFRLSETCDPLATLFYNDHSLEFNTIKRRSVINYLNDLRSRGVKIDGVGLQMHITLAYPPLEVLQEAFEEISMYGYKIHLSELDISVQSVSDKVSPLQKQAERLKSIIELYRQLPQHLQYGITFWGLRDNDSWLNEFAQVDKPLLFDEKNNAKPAYYAIKNLKNI